MKQQRTFAAPCPCGRGPATHAPHEILSGRRWLACDACWDEYRARAAAATEDYDAAERRRRQTDAQQHGRARGAAPVGQSKQEEEP